MQMTITHPHAIKTIACTAFSLFAFSLPTSANTTRTAPAITGDAVVKSTIGLAGPGIPADGKSEGIPHIQWMVSDTASGPFTPMQGVTGRRSVLGANLINKWLKAQITTAEAAGNPGKITETKPVQVKDRAGNPNVDFMAKNPLGLSFTFDREYIKRCAANAAEGIQKKADGKEESWDETIAAFDVEAFAKEVKSTGAGYVIFALGQNSGYYCSPNTVIEKAAGCAPNTLCSKRDLPLEIMRVLKPYGIPVILYLPGSPPTLNAAINKSMGCGGNSVPTQTTVKCWNAAIEEWSLRYGTELSGWWIDGMWFPASYQMTNAENWHSRAAALKAGNPACAITLNEGGKMRTPCPYIDMTDGESNNLGPAPKHGRWADPVNRVQWFIYTFIGANDPHYAGWGNKGVCRTVKDLDAWLGRVFARGGAVTLDVKVNRFGHIDPEQLKLLKDTPACHGKYPKLDPNLFNDDSETIAYAGNWVAYEGRDGDYEGDVHATARNGDSFTFTFTGSGVEMIGEKNVDLGEIELRLDGKPAGTVNGKAAAKSTRQSLFRVRNLPKVKHTLTGVKVSGGYMVTDLFKIEP